MYVWLIVTIRLMLLCGRLFRKQHFVSTWNLSHGGVCKGEEIWHDSAHVPAGESEGFHWHRNCTNCKWGFLWCKKLCELRLLCFFRLVDPFIVHVLFWVPWSIRAPCEWLSVVPLLSSIFLNLWATEKWWYTINLFLQRTHELQSNIASSSERLRNYGLVWTVEISSAFQI